jgi:hypothetical protein
MPFTHKTNSSGDIRFEVHFSMAQAQLEKNELYKLSIVNVPKQPAVDVKNNISTSAAAMQGQDEVTVTKQAAEGTLEQMDEKEIYAIHFRSSSYATFAEKMAAVPNSGGGVWQEYPHVYNLISNVYDYTNPAEMFDVAEVANLYEDNLVVAEPLYEQTSWYTQKVAPLIYNAQMLSDAGLSGTKPAVQNVVTIGNGSPKQLDDNVLSVGSRLSIDPWGSIQYRAAAFIDSDYGKIRNAVVNKNVKSAEATALLNSNHIPDMTNGQYPVRFSYKLPGAKGQITSSVERMVALTGFID